MITLSTRVSGEPGPADLVLAVFLAVITHRSGRSSQREGRVVRAYLLALATGGAACVVVGLLEIGGAGYVIGGVLIALALLRAAARRVLKVG